MFQVDVRPMRQRVEAKTAIGSDRHNVQREAKFFENDQTEKRQKEERQRQYVAIG